MVAAHLDPFPAVAGQGVRRLREQGVIVELGLCEQEARALNAPFLKRVATGQPWVLAKWAMSWDGKIATSRGDSRWISSAASRQIVHQLRGRVDAILIGRGTAEADDPLLTARPTGPRRATRVVLDSNARLSLQSQLVRTARDVPVLLATGPGAAAERSQHLEAAGCEIWSGSTADPGERLRELLQELGRRGMTNVLVEGGAAVLGTLLDQQLVDEVHVFIAPKIIGGRDAPSAVGGRGQSLMEHVGELQDVRYALVDCDIYASGRIAR